MNEKIDLERVKLHVGIKCPQIPDVEMDLIHFKQVEGTPDLLVEMGPYQFLIMAAEIELLALYEPFYRGPEYMRIAELIRRRLQWGADNDLISGRDFLKAWLKSTFLGKKTWLNFPDQIDKSRMVSLPIGKLTTFIGWTFVNKRPEDPLDVLVYKDPRHSTKVIQFKYRGEEIEILIPRNVIYFNDPDPVVYSILWKMNQVNQELDTNITAGYYK